MKLTCKSLFKNRPVELDELLYFFACLQGFIFKKPNSLTGLTDIRPKVLKALLNVFQDSILSFFLTFSCFESHG